MRPKILIDDNIPFIKGRLEPVADVDYLDQFGFTPDSIKGADALIIRTRTRCNKNLLDGSTVKLIATATIGTDQIDIPWCAENGIMVCNSPGCNAPGVAQYVWSALLREGFDPHKHRLGVVGCGNVGSIVADWGRLLGAEVWVNDPPRQNAGIPDEYHTLDEIMGNCDAVTLHTPLIINGDYPSYHLIGKHEIDMMKDGAILVNAARGAVLDTSPVLEAVRQGKIKGIIDTWEGEPELNKELLKKVDIGTYHIAGYSKEGKERATRMVLEAVEDFFNLEVDKSGLASAYTPWNSITAEEIVSSYNPYVDSEALKKNPDEFDELRRNYNYREEVRGE